MKHIIKTIYLETSLKFEFTSGSWDYHFFVFEIIFAMNFCNGLFWGTASAKVMDLKPFLGQCDISTECQKWISFRKNVCCCFSSIHLFVCFFSLSRFLVFTWPELSVSEQPTFNIAWHLWNLWFLFYFSAKFFLRIASNKIEIRGKPMPQEKSINLRIRGVQLNTKSAVYTFDLVDPWNSNSLFNKKILMLVCP